MYVCVYACERVYLTYAGQMGVCLSKRVDLMRFSILYSDAVSYQSKSQKAICTRKPKMNKT